MAIKPPVRVCLKEENKRLTDFFPTGSEEIDFYLAVKGFERSIEVGSSKYERTGITRKQSIV